MSTSSDYVRVEPSSLAAPAGFRRSRARRPTRRSRYQQEKNIPSLWEDSDVLRSIGMIKVDMAHASAAIRSQCASGKVKYYDSWTVLAKVQLKVQGFCF